ncbi:probable inactive allantoicase [Phymastichus coffea]|uniref:probable inactive allantoicase n=1 Tax=Phymastichus coffea TaxID=108790 RepID=UPI00273AEB54|nr:probable inactive allantoicase [Phymastichus coffea]
MGKNSQLSSNMVKIPDFVNDKQEISSAENGAKILFATDDFFAVAENLLKPEEPYWNEEYTEFGKWMDGWETRRKRIPGHDWVIIALAGQNRLDGVCVDTAFFTGNHAPRFSLQAACMSEGVGGIQSRKDKMGTAANNRDLENAEKLHSESWETLIPMTALKSGSPETRKNFFELSSGERVYTHLRFNIFPDGGVARLRVYGRPTVESARLGSSEPIRGKCVEYSDAHYGHPDALLHPWPSRGMNDAWETARRLDRPPTIDVDDRGFTLQKGEEWAILQLEKSIYVERIQVDTTHFKGNCPDSVKIEAAYVEPDEDHRNATWETVLNRTKLTPNQSNGLKHPLMEATTRAVNHIKVTIAPDGGLARIRIYGSDA